MGQPRRSVEGLGKAPSGAHGCGIQHRPEGSARGWDAGKPLASTPKPGRIVNIAVGGRQRRSIWEMSVETTWQREPIKDQRPTTVVGRLTWGIPDRLSVERECA